MKRHPLMDRFQFCPACGASGLEQLSLKSVGCRGCGFEFFFNPASAAGAFLCDRSGRALFVRRSREPSRGKLGLPGGFVDAFETLEQALRREVMEEVGLDIAGKPCRFLCSQPNLYRYNELDYCSVDAYFEVELESLAGARACDECSELAVADPAALNRDELAFDSLKKAVEIFLRNRGAGR